MSRKTKMIGTVALAAAVGYNASIAQVANELWTPGEDDGVMQNGIIYGANEARFTASTYSEPLTNYIVGWRDPENLEELLESIAPAVTVSRRFEFKKAENAEAFLSEDDDVRSIGSSFKRVEHKGTTVNEKTLNKGLTIRLDKDDMLDGDEELAVARLTQRLLRNEVRRALALIAAAATNANKVWNETKNPDKDIRDALVLGANASGIYPNRILFAENAFNLRKDAYELQDTPAAGRAADKTPGELAGQFMVDLVKVIKARYQSTASAKAGVQTTLTVLLYNAMNGIGKDDPSNIKRFVTPTGSGKFRVYRKESDKFIDITVEHYSNSVITSTLGIRQLTVAAT